jgi:hypothetical protein
MHSRNNVKLDVFNTRLQTDTVAGASADLVKIDVAFLKLCGIMERPRSWRYCFSVFTLPFVSSIPVRLSFSFSLSFSLHSHTHSFSVGLIHVASTFFVSFLFHLSRQLRAALTRMHPSNELIYKVCDDSTTHTFFFPFNRADAQEAHREVSSRTDTVDEDELVLATDSEDDSWHQSDEDGDEDEDDSSDESGAESMSDMDLDQRDAFDFRGQNDGVSTCLICGKHRSKARTLVVLNYFVR